MIKVIRMQAVKTRSNVNCHAQSQRNPFPLLVTTFLQKEFLQISLLTNKYDKYIKQSTNYKYSLEQTVTYHGRMFQDDK